MKYDKQFVTMPEGVVDEGWVKGVMELVHQIIEEYRLAGEAKGDGFFYDRDDIEEVLETIQFNLNNGFRVSRDTLEHPFRGRKDVIDKIMLACSRNGTEH